MKKTRALIYICENDLTQQIGGTIHVKKVLASLIKLHPDITLIAPDYHNVKIDISPGIKTIFLKTGNRRIIKWLYFYLASTIKIIRIRLKHPGIFIYSREMPYNLFLPLCTKLLNIPHFIEINGVILDEIKDLHYRKTAYQLTRIIEKMILSLANHIISVSDEIKKSVGILHNITQNKITTTPNGTDIHTFYPINKNECRKQLGLDQSKYIIGFIGSCYPYHDIDTLISAFHLLIQRHPFFHLLIVGDGYQLESWKELAEKLSIQNSITFTGYVPFEQANLFINAFDICFASYKQGTSVFPMKIMDYLACNKPVIASNILSITRYFQNLPQLKFIEPGNKEILADTILEMYRKRNEVISSHREFVLNNYTWDHTARNIINTIEKTLCAASPE